MLRFLSFLELFCFSVSATAAARSVTPWTNSFPPSYQVSNGSRNHEHGGHNTTCIRGLVPITVCANNVKLDFQAPSDTVDVVQDILSFTGPGSSFPQQINKGTQPVSGTYDIYYSLCLPASGADNVHFLTHGLGFDHTYWDVPGSSYVEAALNAGSATFAYDRLGYGRSHNNADPVREVQAPMHVAIASQLLTKLKSGSFANQTFSTITAIGHSYGSIITEALAADPANPIDAAILTGFSLNFTAVPEFTLALNLDNAAHGQNPQLQNYTPGYLAPTSAVGWQIGFLTAPYFDPRIPRALVSSDGILTFGELFSRSAITKATTNFMGPVFVINGDADLPYCGGSCTFPTDKVGDALKNGFPRSRNASSYVLARTGHGINLHFSAEEAYRRMLGFLKDNGF